jgi:hypothetical protein
LQLPLQAAFEQCGKTMRLSNIALVLTATYGARDAAWRNLETENGFNLLIEDGFFLLLEG